MITKTYYLTRDLIAPNGRKHFKGGSIQTADESEKKWIEEQLNAPLKTVPIEKRPPPPKPPDPEDED